MVTTSPRPWKKDADGRIYSAVGQEVKLYDFSVALRESPNGAGDTKLVLQAVNQLANLGRALAAVLEVCSQAKIDHPVVAAARQALEDARKA